MKQLIIGLLVLLCLQIEPNLAQARSIINWNDGWEFSYDTKSWEQASLPNTWNRFDGLKQDYFRGQGWYRKRFQVSEARAERIFLRFEAVNQTADVFLNEKWLGRHEGGYTAFAIELTPHLLRGQDNIVLVRADNSMNANIAPITGDFTSFGGIYRDVHLIRVSESHISLLDHGSMGVYVHPKSVTSERADIEIEAKLLLAGARDHQLRMMIADASGKVVANREQQVDDINKISFQIDKPRLWDGLSDPHLYSVATQLLENGNVVDEVKQTFGLRTFRVDPEHGLYLNGKRTPVRGVAYHQDWERYGWSLRKDHMIENVRLLREMGANAVRLAHYPHAQTTLDALDRNGVIAWAEIPIVDRVGASPEFEANSRTQLIEMIRQNLNHPSILFWGLYNEVREGPEDVLKRLNTLAHKEDPSRLTTAAFEGIPGKTFEPITDIIGVNAYFGWYRGEPKDLIPYLDGIRKQFPQVPIGVSEYGAGGSPFVHQDPVRRPETTSRQHPEEWQTFVHEAHLHEFKTRPSIWGHFVWNFFDFASAARREGDRDGVNDKGLITYDRQIKKDAFYLYKANWNPEPMVYITSRRHTEREQAMMDVKVYSNMETLELVVNGQAIESTRANREMIWIWKDVPLQKGRNLLQVTSRQGSEVVTDTVMLQRK